MAIVLSGEPYIELKHKKSGFVMARRTLMFGTIGHARRKPGTQAQLEALFQEWEQTIRPQIPGDFIQRLGHVAGQPED